MGRSALIKILIGLAALAVLGVLFVRSVHDARSAPYTVAREHLQNWVLVLEPQTSATAPMLVLRPPVELVSSIFRQLFSRAMESLSTPATPGMPLVLQGEHDLALAGRLTPDAILDTARDAGLESTAFEPHCLAYRRHSEPRATRQLYYLLFDAPAFGHFREQLAGRLADGEARPGTFDPHALSPVLIVAASDAAFHRWLPIRADPDTECVAPLDIEALSPSQSR
jgi:hypothetical protein